MFADKPPSMRRSRGSFLSCFFPEPADDWNEQHDHDGRGGQRGMLQVDNPATAPTYGTAASPAAGNGASVQKSPSAAANGRSTSNSDPVVVQASPKPARTTLVYSKSPSVNSAPAPSLPQPSAAASASTPSVAPANGTSGATPGAFVPFVPHPDPSRPAGTSLQAQLTSVMDQRSAASSSLATATQHLDAVNSRMQQLAATADLLGLEGPPQDGAGGTKGGTAAQAVHLLDMPVAPIAYHSPHINFPPMGHTGAHGGVSPPPAYQPSPLLPVSHHPGFQPSFYAAPPPSGPPTSSALHPSASWVAFHDAHPPPAQADLRAVASAPSPATSPAQQPSFAPSPSSGVAAPPSAVPHPATPSGTRLPAVQPPVGGAAPAPAVQLPAGAGTAGAPAAQPSPASLSREQYTAGMSTLQSDVAQTKAYMAEMAAKLELLQKQEAKLREELAASADAGDQLAHHNSALAKELEAHEMIYASTIAETSTLHRDLQVTRAELNAVKATERQKDELIEILQAQLADTQQQLFETQDGVPLQHDDGQQQQGHVASP